MTIKSWKDVTRSTEEEHQAFMKALNGLLFSRDEWITEGPSVIIRKYREVLAKLPKDDDTP